MDDHPQERSGGLFDSLRALLETVVAVLHNRSELFTTEIEEELTRLVSVLVWGIAAVFSMVIGSTFLGAMILLVAPPAYRVWTAAGLAILFLAFPVFAWLAIRRILRAKPRPFDASLSELEKDLSHLRGTQ